MKTISPKDAFKLILFLLILFSAKTFSHPKLPTVGSPSDCESRIGVVKKTTNNLAIPSSTKSSASKGHASMKSNATSKSNLKVAVSK